MVLLGRQWEAMMRQRGHTVCERSTGGPPPLTGGSLFLIKMLGANFWTTLSVRLRCIHSPSESVLFMFIQLLGHWTGHCYSLVTLGRTGRVMRIHRWLQRTVQYVYMCDTSHSNHNAAGNIRRSSSGVPLTHCVTTQSSVTVQCPRSWVI